MPDGPLLPSFDVPRHAAVFIIVTTLAACQSAPSPSLAPSRAGSPAPPSAGSPPPPSATASASPLVRYVAADGDDGAAGTASAPWATLQRAADSAEPGTTIVVDDGVYAGFTIRRSGAPNAPVRFEAAEAAAPVVEEAGRQYLVHVDGASDIVLSGLEIRGATEQDGAGVYVAPGSSTVSILNSRLVDNRSFGILIEDSRDVTVQGSDISGSGSGVRTRGDVAGTMITANDIHDNDIMVVSDPEPNNDTGGQAIALSLTTGPITVQNNRIWGNRAESIDYGTDGSAFEIFGASDVLITENVIWDNETVMETGTNREYDCADIRFLRNVAYADASWGESKGILLRCARDSLVAHNTLVGFDEWAFQFRNRVGSQFGGSIEQLTVVNNVVSGRFAFYLQDPLPGSVVVDYNLVDRGFGTFGRIGDETVDTLDAFVAATGLQRSGRHADPRFVDPGSRDFSLLPGSPAVDAALPIDGVNESFSGSGPDIGRFELG